MNTAKSIAGNVSGQPAGLLQALLQACAEHAERPALCSAQRTLSYGELATQVQGWAEALGRKVAGQRILLRVNAAPDDAAVLFFACLAAGAVPALADPAWGEAECRTLARRYGCTQWVGDQAFEGDIAFSPTVSSVATRSLYRQQLDTDAVPPLDARCSFIRFSSGSTGLPRAIEFSSAGALAIARTWAAAAGLDKDARILCYATLNNGLAFNTSLLPGLLCGASLRLEPSFLTAKAVLSAAREFKPTVFVAFPLVYEFLAKRPAADVQQALGGTRLRLSSASALSPAIRAAWCDVHGMPIGNYYGIAEVGPVSFNDGSDQQGMGRKLASVQLFEPKADAGSERWSVLTPWMGLRYVPAAGDKPDVLNAGQPYATSDRLLIDSKGQIQLGGRSDGVVNLHGKKVSLGALNEALAPELPQAAFIFVPGESDGGAYLSLHVESQQLSAADVQAACARVLPPHAIPRRVQLHQRLPRSSAGKVLVAALAA